MAGAERCRAVADDLCRQLDVCAAKAGSRAAASAVAAARETLAAEEEAAVAALADAKERAVGGDGSVLDAALAHMAKHPELYSMFDIRHNMPPPSPQRTREQYADGSSAAFQQHAASVIDGWVEGGGEDCVDDRRAVADVLRHAEALTAATGISFRLLPPGVYDVGSRLREDPDAIGDHFRIKLDGAHYARKLHPLWHSDLESFIGVTPQREAHIPQAVLVSERPLTRKQIEAAATVCPDVAGVQLPDPRGDCRVPVPLLRRGRHEGFVTLPCCKTTSLCAVTDALQVENWTADEICAALGGRLLGWEEWEVAVRGVEGGLFPEGLEEGRCVLHEFASPEGGGDVTVHILRDGKDAPTPFGLCGVTEVGAKEWNSTRGGDLTPLVHPLIRPPGTHIVRSCWDLGTSHVLEDPPESDALAPRRGSNTLVFSGPSACLYSVTGGGIATAGVRLALPLPVTVHRGGSVRPVLAPHKRAEVAFDALLPLLGATLDEAREVLGFEEELLGMSHGRDRDARWFSTGVSAVLRAGGRIRELHLHSGSARQGTAFLLPAFRYSPFRGSLPTTPPKQLSALSLGDLESSWTADGAPGSFRLQAVVATAVSAGGRLSRIVLSPAA
eukprot:TRINITY_DN24500_c0_g1_i1.p1 TRINITY_DN24500_c0_g1~~TRINITY_DN24500_c0_g1_i1.p1  ORF type:complete len:683 (+),score=184.05 TRINITY_DN24500_c0_g1_i1:205-2049(+)